MASQWFRWYPPSSKRLLSRGLETNRFLSLYEDGEGALWLGTEDGGLARHPHWVLMDIKMEGVNGIAATREIKAVFRDARVVISPTMTTQSLGTPHSRPAPATNVLKEDLLSLRGIIGYPKNVAG